MSPQFWDAPMALQIGMTDVTVHMGRLSLEVHQILYHRVACLVACRETLRIYHLMRSKSIPAFDMINIVDYRALICAVITLLGILGYGNSKPPPLSLITTNENEFEIVESSIPILRLTSRNLNNKRTLQAVQGLDALAMLVRYSTGRDKTGHYAVLVPPTFFLNDLSGAASSSPPVPIEEVGQVPSFAAAVDIDISMMYPGLDQYVRQGTR
ncbi:uncharacterized protein RAG0_01790 [Rhynchosporium agropyri]|uniref:Uncharacterized protein n=1 Tax=Rhynchosporium agropyri TaxID=914238 RepID=A0A1E1JYJ3_9HELO|nr:uncharacterized protein RAG0_01790 [Rhynchosporium agropyri]